jgi:hypothetical protein
MGKHIKNATKMGTLVSLNHIMAIIMILITGIVLIIIIKGLNKSYKGFWIPQIIPSKIPERQDKKNPAKVL